MGTAATFLHIDDHAAGNFAVAHFLENIRCFFQSTQLHLRHNQTFRTEWGLEDSAESLRTFAMNVYEGCAPYAAALKPQVALFERHGSAGLAVLEELFARAAEDRVLIVADAKRGDIGSTMKAYADAHRRSEERRVGKECRSRWSPYH